MPGGRSGGRMRGRMLRHFSPSLVAGSASRSGSNAASAARLPALAARRRGGAVRTRCRPGARPPAQLFRREARAVRSRPISRGVSSLTGFLASAPRRTSHHRPSRARTASEERRVAPLGQDVLDEPRGGHSSKSARRAVDSKRVKPTRRKSRLSQRERTAHEVAPPAGSALTNSGAQRKLVQDRGVLQGVVGEERERVARLVELRGIDLRRTDPDAHPFRTLEAMARDVQCGRFGGAIDAAFHPAQRTRSPLAREKSNAGNVWSLPSRCIRAYRRVRVCS